MTSPVLENGLLVLLGLLPSLVWLFFFYKRDSHPEPKYLISKTFLMGILIAPLAVILQLILVSLGDMLSLDFLSQGTATFFVWAAFVEESVKLLCVQIIVLRSPEFDEPVDAMIYMITAALGFAAIENILFMFKVVPQANLLYLFKVDSHQAQIAISIWALRFTGATLLHALSSALLGYFLAVSWFYQHHKKKLIVIGLAMATLFHATFNIFLSSFENQQTGLLLSDLVLVIMALMVFILFSKIKERHNKLLATATLA